MSDGHSSGPPVPHAPKSWKHVAMLGATVLVTALGGAFASLCTAWVGGIVTHGDLDAAFATRDKQIEAVATRTVVLEAASSDHTKRLKPLEDGDLERRRARELLVTEIRKRIGLQAKVQVGMDQRKADQAERLAAYVCAKFDDYIFRQEEPMSAAEKALEAARLQH